MTSTDPDKYLCHRHCEKIVDRFEGSPFGEKEAKDLDYFGVLLQWENPVGFLHRVQCACGGKQLPAYGTAYWAWFGTLFQTVRSWNRSFYPSGLITL